MYTFDIESKHETDNVFGRYEYYNIFWSDIIKFFLFDFKTSVTTRVVFHLERRINLLRNLRS